MAKGNRSMRFGAACSSLMAMAGAAAGQHCSPEWVIEDFGMPGAAPPGTVNRFAIHDDGSGLALFATGTFSTMGGNMIRGVAKWDGAVWSGLGAGVPGRVSAVGVFNDGQRTLLYVGGTFTTAGGVPANSIARWDGQSWSPVGTGLAFSTAPGVYTMAVYDLGTGPSLFIGGTFSSAGGVPAMHIARWDGAAWHNVGDVIGMGFGGGSVNTLLVWDDGLGPALYAGGNITSVAGLPVSGIARLTAGGWSALGPGVSGGLERVNALVAYDDGTGEALYVGGNYTHVGGIPGSGIEANHIGRWDGAAWSALPGGGFDDEVNSLATFDDGSGPALFVGGGFNMAGNVPVSHIARWKDGQWSDLMGGVLHPVVTTVSAMVVHDDGTGLGPALYIGGGFAEAGGLPAGSLARWACVGVCYANCDGSTTEPILNVDDFTCFINEFASAQALPHEQQLASYANCDGSTTAPVLNVDDFTCFINAFAAGCP